MSQHCLNCGTPLGGDSTLCYGCRSSGVTADETVDVDDSTLERIERYFIVSAVKCANCDELHTTVAVDGTEYTAADFGIDTLEEWRLEMDKEEEWIAANSREVRALLPRLEDEWPESVRALRNHVLA